MTSFAGALRFAKRENEANATSKNLKRPQYLAVTSRLESVLLRRTQ